MKNRGKKRIACILAVCLLLTVSFDISYAGPALQNVQQQSDAEHEKQSESQKETESEKQSESIKETESEKQSESQKETESEKQSESQKETESEKQSESIKETESEKQSESIKETESEKQSESQKETESEKNPELSELPVERSTVLSSVRNYILNRDSNPDFSSIWNVIGLQRSGLYVPESYIETFYRNVYQYCEQKNWKLTRTKYSDYSKLIMALTSIGVDARNVGGHNLFSYLSDYENVRMQGINGSIWALIALNCHPSYTIPGNKEAEVQTTEEMLLQAILDAQCTDGGWDLAGIQGDSDMTGMALQALSFYYGKRADVDEAVNRGLAWVSEHQLQSGGFGTQGVETSESVSQVLVALSGLGIDGSKDSRFVKNGKWPLSGLFQYYLPEGGFMHVAANAGNNGGGIGGMLDGMATEQGFYATVAYQRLLDGRSFLYDMSDVELHAGEKQKTAQTEETEETKKQEETEKKKENKKKNEKKEKKKKTEGKQNESEKKQTTPQTAAPKPSGQTRTLPSAKKTAAVSSKEQKRSDSSKTTKAKKKKETEIKESGWSFEGEDYVPDLTSGSETETETSVQSEENSSKTQDKSMAPAVLLGAAAVLILEAAAFGVYRKKKGRKIR